MPHDIFISYSTENTDWAEGVCQLLESNGHTCWMAPRDICPGATWGAEIVRGINEARIMLLLLSSASNHSRQVAREVQLADSAQLAMIPVLLEAIKPEGDFLYFIGNMQWLTAIGGDPKTHATTLLAAVRTELANVEARQTASAAASGSPPPPLTPIRDSKPMPTGGSGAAAQPALSVASTPAPAVNPPSASVAVTPMIAVGPVPDGAPARGPWLWVALGAAVLLAALLWFAFSGKPTAPTALAQQPGAVAFSKSAPWAGTYEGEVGKSQLIIHISEESPNGHHEFQITVDNATTGKQGERAVSIDLARDGRLTFALGEQAAPRAQCAVQLTSDRQSLTGEWRQLAANRTLRVDFKRTSAQP